MNENSKDVKMKNGEVGQRVRLISTSRPDVGVKCGDIGTIWHIVASNGVRRVRWDNGARLDLNPERTNGKYWIKLKKKWIEFSQGRSTGGEEKVT